MTATISPTTGTATCAIDSAHSSAEFSVKHMVVATARGSFGHVEGTLTFDPANLTAGNVDARVKVDTITTNQEQRDAHLKSDDFFSAEQFPWITFQSTKIEGKGDDIVVHGDLTIRDQTHPVKLNAELDGFVDDSMSKTTRASFTASGEISRQQFGLTWNALLESGGAVVSDKVKLTLHIAALLQS